MKFLKIFLITLILGSCSSNQKNQESPSEKINKIESNSNNLFKNL